MIYEGFEGLFSQSKSIKNHFPVEVAMKCAPRRPRDVSRRLQEAPKTLPRRLKASKTVPGRPQDGPKTAPGRSKTPPGRSKTLPQAPPKNQYFLHFSYVGLLVGLWWAFAPHQTRTKDPPKRPTKDPPKTHQRPTKTPLTLNAL